MHEMYTSIETLGFGLCSRFRKLIELKERFLVQSGLKSQGTLDSESKPLATFIALKVKPNKDNTMD